MLIPEEMKKCVVFVAMEKNSGGKQMMGTAFLVGRHLEGTDRSEVYLVTAKHVIDEIRKHSAYKVFLRVNLRQGGWAWYETPLEDWLSHPDEDQVDVSVLPFPCNELVDIIFLPLAVFATKDTIGREGIGIGDEVFLIGLFSQHYGSERNIPIARVGNIAAMPEEKVATTGWGDMEAYLVEARSIGGISGSPVFVYLGAHRRSGKMVIGQPSFYLLGLMHGHWDQPQSALDYKLGMGGERINTGIAIVVPATKILEVVKQPSLEKIADEMAMELRLRNFPIPDVSIVDTSMVSKDPDDTSPEI